MYNVKFIFDFYVFSKTYLWCIVGYTAVVFVTGTLALWAPATINHALAAKNNLNKTELLSTDERKR